MESVAEIEEMRVSELREFLTRNGVPVASVSRVDGTPGYPRKSDLLAAALNLRADYENPQVVTTGPHTPNIFQTGYSPPRKGTPSTVKKRSSLVKPEFSEKGSVKSASVTKEKKPKRRSSVGWIKPSVLAALSNPDPTDSAHSDDAKEHRDTESDGDKPKVVVSKKEQQMLVDARNYAEAKAESDVGDAADHLIPSDYDSAGASSGVDSDGGSVVDTDDEQSTTLFKQMKMYELRSWLTDHNVPFNHRSKKAELVSLATAHALYLENKQNTSSSAAKSQRRGSQPTPFEKQTQKRVTVRSNPVSQIDPDEVQWVRTSSVSQTAKERDARKERVEEVAKEEQRVRRRLRARVITAPLPDDDGADADHEDEVEPVHRPARRQDGQTTATRVGNQRMATKRGLQGLRMPQVRIPPINSRIVVLVMGCILAAVFLASIVNLWLKSKRPFCNTGATNC